LQKKELVNNFMLTAIVVKGTINNVKRSLQDMYEQLSETGSLFALISSEYSGDGDVLQDFTDIIEAGICRGYEYVNTIVAPTKNKQVYSIIDNVLYIVWFVKDKNKMYFDKDAIREKHIWKDIEWGKRKKNYNPKGKDPGNVWIPTVDDGKGKIVKHVFMGTNDIVNRLLSATKHGKSLVLLDDDKESIINENSTCLLGAKKKHPASSKCTGDIFFGTAENMDKIKNSSVDLFVTSPPYWDLKDYYKEGQIGKEPYDEYLKRINKVWAECKKKLKTSGSLWININIRVRANAPVLLPKDIAAQCKNLGFCYKGIIIWHKSSGIPTHKNNIVDRHEYVLVFAKSDKSRINLSALESFSDYINTDISGGAFWNINRKAGSVGKKYIHPAIYPNELVDRIIKCCTNPMDTVADPFVGSGTTLISALKNGRNFVGYEYNEGFGELMEFRFSNEIADLYGNVNFHSTTKK